MKKVIILFLLMFCLLNANDSKYKIARLHYSGGDWYNDPDMLPNLADFMNKELKSDYFVVEQAIVEPTESELKNTPFLFLTGHGNIKFNDKERKAIRNYLLNGGFIYADDDYGLDKSFRKEMKKILPEFDFVELSGNHDLFNCYFTFNKGLPKIHEHDKKKPQAFGIFDKNGKLLVLYTYESNISDGWASPNVHKDPEEVRQMALRMGMNIIYYVMTN